MFNGGLDMSGEGVVGKIAEAAMKAWRINRSFSVTDKRRVAEFAAMFLDSPASPCSSTHAK